MFSVTSGVRAVSGFRDVKIDRQLGRFALDRYFARLEDIAKNS